MLRWSNANFCCDFNVGMKFFEKGFSWETLLYNSSPGGLEQYIFHEAMSGKCNFLKKTPAEKCNFLKNDSIKGMYFFKRALAEQCNILRNASVRVLRQSSFFFRH